MAKKKSKKQQKRDRRRANRANKRKCPRRNNRHHIIPRSRGGNAKSVVRINMKVHEAWHLLFGNALPYEAQLLIDKYWSTPEVAEEIEIPGRCREYFTR